VAKALHISDQGVVSVVEEDPQALAALGSVPTYEQAHLGPVFASAVTRYAIIKEDIEVLKHEKDVCSERIVKALAEGGLRKVSVKRNIVTLVDSTRNSLNREKLVENLIALGMSAQKINDLLTASEVHANFTFIRIDSLKAKNGRSGDR
jgi:hypothetical protein